MLGSGLDLGNRFLGCRLDHGAECGVIRFTRGGLH